MQKGFWDSYAPPSPRLKDGTATVNPDGVKNQIDGNIVQATFPF